MRSGGNNCKYFPINKLTKLANFVQFYVCLCFVWRIGGEPRPPGPPSATPLYTAVPAYYAAVCLELFNPIPALWN